MSGDKWQSKTLFLTIFSTFVESINVFDCHLSGVFLSEVIAKLEKTQRITPQIKNPTQKPTPSWSIFDEVTANRIAALERTTAYAISEEVGEGGGG